MCLRDQEKSIEVIESREIMMKKISKKSFSQIKTLVFKGVAMAMAVAVVVLNILGSINLKTQVQLLGIGLAYLVVMKLEIEKEAGK